MQIGRDAVTVTTNRQVACAAGASGQGLAASGTRAAVAERRLCCGPGRGSTGAQTGPSTSGLAWDRASGPQAHGEAPLPWA